MQGGGEKEISCRKCVSVGGGRRGMHYRTDWNPKICQKKRKGGEGKSLSDTCEKKKRGKPD